MARRDEWRPGDWHRAHHLRTLSDPWISRLPPAWENAYRRLRDYNFKDGFLPNDPDELAYLAKLDDDMEEFARFWKHVQKRFSTAIPQQFHSTGRKKRFSFPDVAAELAYQHNKSTKRSGAAKKRWDAAKSRDEKDSGRSDDDAIAQQLQSKSSADAQQLQSFARHIEEEGEVEEEAETELEKSDQNATTPTGETSNFAQAENPSGSSPVWWERDELMCTPDYAAELGETYPTIPWKKIRATWIKFQLKLAGPLKKRREELIRDGKLHSWIESRIQEDFAQELAEPRNTEERLADQSSDRRRKDRNR